MKLYIISLATSTDRRGHMEQQLNKLGITDYEFVLAETKPNPVEACMKSHQKVWSLIRDKGEAAVVLEDDAVLHDSFYHHLNQRFARAYDMAHVYLLGYQVHGTPLWHSYIQDWRTAQVATSVTFNGAYGYVVNGTKAADLLLKLSEKVKHHPDLFIMDAANTGKLTLFFMNHPIILHGGFPSTLNHEGTVNAETEKEKPAVQSKIKNQKSKIVAPKLEELKKLKITLLHPSRGRAQKAQQTFDLWLKKSSGKLDIQHIVSVDESDPQRKEYEDLFPTSRVLVRDNDCVVEATNRAARFATGDILIYLSDDFTCPENWDLLLAAKFIGTKKPMLLQVRDGINEAEVECLTIPVMNKQLYKKLGYFWHPAYRSMFVDNDLYHTCKNNGWLSLTPELVFEHEHWINKKAEVDETYKKSEANWKQGEAVFNTRKEQNFPIK